MNTGNTFPVVHSIPSAEALRDQVLAGYHPNSNVSCQLFHRGINDTYLITAGDVQRYLRISPAGARTRAQIEAEVGLLDHLTRQKLAVPRPVVASNGSVVQEIAAPEGTRYAVLFEHIDGMPNDDLTPEQSELYGKTAAEIHRLTDGHMDQFARFHLDHERIFEEPLQQMARFFPQRQDEIDLLRQLGAQAMAKIATLPTDEPAYGICHGDLLPEHIHFDGNGGTSILDFDEFGAGWRAYDIAVFFWRHLFPMPRDPEGQIREAFLSGYQSERPLSPAELEAIPYFVLLRHIWAGGGTIHYLSLREGVEQIFFLFDHAVGFAVQWAEANFS